MYSSDYTEVNLHLFWIVIYLTWPVSNFKYLIQCTMYTMKPLYWRRYEYSISSYGRCPCGIPYITDVLQLPDVMSSAELRTPYVSDRPPRTSIIPGFTHTRSLLHSPFLQTVSRASRDTNPLLQSSTFRYHHTHWLKRRTREKTFFLPPTYDRRLRTNSWPNEH